MPRSSAVAQSLPPVALAALRQLGANLAIARKRRKESQRAWALRIGVSARLAARLLVRLPINTVSRMTPKDSILMATNLLNQGSPSRPATGTIRVAVASGDGVRELDGASALEALPTLTAADVADS